MEVSKTLRRPSNWQDFETLCKKLWGEIWNCPEIKKNGRSGQNQNGIDIYAIPSNDNQYWGIQCKGKDEYTNKQFTQKEISDEIEKAKNFQPPLKKMYFATTAIKDVDIEEFVRKKNIENQEKNLFEVHIFCWEDIVELIDENKHTHDWYLKNQNYKTAQRVSVTFQDNNTQIICHPKFKRVKQLFFKKRVIQEDYMQKVIGLSMPYKHQIKIFTNKKNLSYIRIEINIHNTGSEPIEEYKMFFTIESDIQELSDTNIINEYGISMPRYIGTPYSCDLDKDKKRGEIVPKKGILVGSDVLRVENIFIKPFPKEADVILKWKLISKDFKADGELLMKIIPEIEFVYETIEAEEIPSINPKYGEIEDYIIEDE